MSGVDRYTLETPENIQVDFELAGIGTRFCAMLVDTLLLGVIAIALFVLLALLDIGGWSAFGVDPRRNAIGAIILAVLVALLMGGYFVLFEWLMRGQTPGKKSLKIRVIRDDGTPVTMHEVLIRNTLRIVDFLPFAYGVGVLFMFPSRMGKRLGDIAAGTIVVKEAILDYRGNADKKYELPSAPVGDLNAELTPAERRLISGFLQRRSELLPNARDQLAQRLARPLFEKYGGEFQDAESYLQRLVRGRHHES